MTYHARYVCSRCGCAPSPTWRTCRLLHRREADSRHIVVRMVENELAAAICEPTPPRRRGSRSPGDSQDTSDRLPPTGSRETSRREGGHDGQSIDAVDAGR